MEKAMLDEMAVDKDEEAEMEENLVHEVLEADTEKITNVSTETDPVVRAPVKTFVEVGTQMQLN